MRIAVAIGTSGLAILLSGCYVAGQGYHLVRNQIRARPIERIVSRSDAGSGDLTPDELQLFNRAEAIRRYAREEIGLSASENYQTYVKTDHVHLVDVVSAARPLSFERKEWWFPIVGRVPYKGYYNPVGARRLGQRLKRRGWDVIVRPVDAFSTLGYFRDPLYTFMARYEESRLAEMIIHEMAHATLWLKDESQFNEEFATFVGLVGSREYLSATYGADSPEVIELDAARADRATFRRDVLQLKEELQRFYDTIPDRSTLSAEEREGYTDEKERIIQAYQERFAERYDEAYSGDQYRGFANRRINNAWIDLFQTYSSGVPVIESFHQRHGSDLTRTIEMIVAMMGERDELPRDERPAPIDMLRE
jgi:predicted aminopeptidase